MQPRQPAGTPQGGQYAPNPTTGDNDLTLAIDLDNTTADYTGQLRRWLRHHGSTAPMPEPDAYDITHATDWNLPHGFTATHNAMVADNGYLLMDPMPHAITTIHDLKAQGWRILALTGREHNPTATRDTRLWCALAGVDRVVFDADKASAARLLGVTAMVEDSPADLTALTGAGVRTLRMDHGYNRDAPGEPCADWLDVARRLS